MAQPYSTDEQDTGLKWIDGRSIYEKTMTANLPGGGATANTPHGIENFGQFVDVRAVAADPGASFPLPYPRTNTAAAATMWMTASNVAIQLGSTGRPGYVGHVTLRYVKSS